MTVGSKDNWLNRHKIKLTKVFVYLSKIVHRVGVGKLKPARKVKEEDTLC